MRLLMHVEYIQRNPQVKDAVIKVVPRGQTRQHEQTLNGTEDFFSGTPAMMHLEIMLVEAALKHRGESRNTQ